MSGPIRKLLGPAKAQLQGYLENTEMFIVLPINEEDVENEGAPIEEYVECIHNNVTIPERCDCEWGTLLSKLKAE